jgi:rubrerythrin
MDKEEILIESQATYRRSMTESVQGRLTLTKKELVFTPSANSSCQEIGFKLEDIVGVEKLGIISSKGIYITRKGGKKERYKLENAKEWIHAIETARREHEKELREATERTGGRRITKEIEVIHEKTRIRCTYCGALIPPDLTQCPNCGAPVRRG